MCLSRTDFVNTIASQVFKMQPPKLHRCVVEIKMKATIVWYQYKLHRILSCESVTVICKVNFVLKREEKEKESTEGLIGVATVTTGAGFSRWSIRRFQCLVDRGDKCYFNFNFEQGFRFKFCQ